MKTVQVEGFQISGIKVRTKNEDEMNPESAKIGALWQGFGSQVAPKLTDGARVYGVYCHYESDAEGAFDVYAGSDGLKDTDQFEQLEVQTGEYMVFSGQGDMPQAVIDTWVAIWQYFSELPERERAYTTDFEFYKSENEVEVYIAVK